MRSPRICFVTPYAHALFTGDPRGFGGAEVQQRLISRALVARGWDVSFVSYAPGPPREEIVENIRFWTVPTPPRGSRSMLRKPALFGLWGGMRRANADLYYQRCAGSITGVAALFARLRGLPFLFSVANDRDLDGSFLREATVPQGLLYRLGVRLATRVIVQTRKQEKLLAERWGREGVLVASACALPADPLPPASARQEVLWVGNMLPKKRPQLMAELASMLPEVTFTMIVPALGDSAFVREVLAALEKAPNLHRLGRVPYIDMPGHYRKAALVVSTSSAEGFANVFLEAWASRT
ncbi:MAG: glycosyltransferase family 4 protein, partial [Deltaproteobacteria bacterium]|nr:glycosyltransferase family 4 protein [Deltaproteobacteria bacterium]